MGSPGATQLKKTFMEFKSLRYETCVSDMEIKHFIAGQWHDSVEGFRLNNVNPATGETIGTLPNATVLDVDKAVAAAKEAFKVWSKTSVQARANYLRAIAKAIENRFDTFALAETQDTGKPLWLSKKLDIPRAIANFEFFANCVEETSSDFLDDQSVDNHTIVRQPIGVAALITPWNLPLYLLTWKIAPALAYGNTVVCKPSELTSTTAHLLTQCMQEAKLPKGVCNIVYGLGSDSGRALVGHSDVTLISFTGGTETGRSIEQDIAGQFKKVSFELGGKNSLIIDEEIDVDAIMDDVIRACFWNQGQICLCAERVLIHHTVYKKFKDVFVKKTKSLAVGDPLDEAHFMGPLISKMHLKKVRACIASRIQAGAKILAGDEPLDQDQGCFMRPTILEGLDPNHALHHEETFGPVVTIEPFDTISQAIELANASPYGLCASVFSNDIETANAAARKLNVGTIWINTWLKRDLRVPFGGMKASGLGREGGMDSIDFFTEKKVICQQAV